MTQLRQMTLTAPPSSSSSSSSTTALLSLPSNIETLSLIRFLREALDNEAAVFRSADQLRAFHHAVFGTQCLAVVLPTGGGKTIIPFAAALANKGKLRVVVTPLNVLKHEFQRRGEDLQVPIHVWDRTIFETLNASSGASNVTLHGLLVISIDLISHSTVQNYLKLEIASKQLVRMYLDEVQLVIADFRPKMGDLWRAIPNGIPFTMLTATLPPSLAPIAFDILRQRPHVLRPAPGSSGTTRTNIEFAVRLRPPSTALTRSHIYKTKLIQDSNLHVTGEGAAGPVTESAAATYSQALRRPSYHPHRPGHCFLTLAFGM